MVTFFNMQISIDFYFNLSASNLWFYFSISYKYLLITTSYHNAKVYFLVRKMFYKTKVQTRIWFGQLPQTHW